MINSYVEGTCDIIQKSLEELPINKRPMYYLAGEDPHQQLMHIREHDKWNTSSELNWMQLIYADDDDDVVNKNSIYYAIKTIDNEKLKYLAYNFNQDKK
jgi:ABC-type microcin C transport system permease subunit YejB